MSGSDDEARRGDAAAGLALLLGGGVAEAITGVEATLTSVQSAAARVFGGLPRVQAAGAAASAVPPVARMAPALAQQAPDGTDRVRPAERIAPPPAMPSAGAERVAAFAPVSVPGGGSVASVVSPAAAAAPSLPPALFASFAPTPSAPGGEARDMAQAVGTVPVMEQTRPGSGARPWAAASVAPVASAAMAPDAGAARPYAPVAQAGGQSGPTGGDVFLDGARVGTWLADHLAREAGRPQTGGAAFDPRLSPAWPGTLQGG